MPKKKVKSVKKKKEALTKAVLSPREQEVVRLVSLGLSVGETASVLKLAPSTIDNHRQRAMVKLGVDKATLLTRMAIKLRITSLKDRSPRSGEVDAGTVHGTCSTTEVLKQETKYDPWPAAVCLKGQV